MTTQQVQKVLDAIAQLLLDLAGVGIDDEEIKQLVLSQLEAKQSLPKQMTKSNSVRQKFAQKYRMPCGCVTPMFVRDRIVSEAQNLTVKALISRAYASGDDDTFWAVVACWLGGLL